MTHYFIDCDVIIDFLGNRKPFSKAASAIFVKAQNKEIKLYTSGNSITIAYYILCKVMPEKSVRALLPVLLKYVHVIPVTDKIQSDAFHSDFKDFEDGVQHFAALTEGRISAIITRNVRDYRKSRLKVLYPDEFL